MNQHSIPAPYLDNLDKKFRKKFILNAISNHEVRKVKEKLTAYQSYYNLSESQVVNELQLVHFVLRSHSISSDIFDYLLLCDPNLNLLDATGNTPLHLCAKYQTDQEIFNALLEQGVTINQYNKVGMTPFEILLMENSLSLQYYALLSCNVDLGNPMLPLSCLHTYLQIFEDFHRLIRIFLRSGVNIDVAESHLSSFLPDAIRTSNIALIKAVFTIQMYFYGNSEKHVINQKIGLNHQSLLHFALNTECDLSMILCLLHEYETPNLGLSDIEGNTPLHACVTRRVLDARLVSTLILKGAEIHQLNRKSMHAWEVLLERCSQEDTIFLENMYLAQVKGKLPCLFEHRTTIPENALYSSISAFLLYGANHWTIGKVYRRLHREPILSPHFMSTRRFN